MSEQNTPTLSDNQYPKIEIEQTEFNVVVVKYYSWNNYEELAHFPYGYKSDEDSSDVAVQKAKDYIKNFNLNTTNQ